MELPKVTEHFRHAAPAVAPQALAWHDGHLWLGSRDLRRIYRIETGSWSVVEELETPGIPWAAVSVGAELYFTLGEGKDDDRYVRRLVPGQGFDESYRMACPEFTGSYLSYDGSYLYLSQWYKHRILQLDDSGTILRTIDVGAEICGHLWKDGQIYLLRGTEQEGEKWTLARLDPAEEKPKVTDLAGVPFACRSLAYDGRQFWTNHRAADETVAFSLPE